MNGIDEDQLFGSRFVAQKVPEPASLLLFGSGLIGLYGLRSFRKIRGFTQLSEHS